MPRLSNINDVVAKARQRGQLSQFFERMAPEMGTFIPKGKSPTESQLVDVARGFGSNAEKALTSAGVIKKPSLWSNLGKGLALGGGLVAGGTAVEAGIGSISGKMQDLQQDRSFDEMLKLHPKLQLEDAERVRVFFNTLWTFAPDMAKDPLVAGTAVYQAMRMDIYGGYPVEAIKTVVEIQNKKSDTKGGNPLGKNLADFLSNSGKSQVIGIYGK